MRAAPLFPPKQNCGSASLADTDVLKILSLPEALRCEHA